MKKWYEKDHQGTEWCKYELLRMITITDKAKEYLDQVRNDDYVTLGVKGGGCSGFTYVWDFRTTG